MLSALLKLSQLQIRLIPWQAECATSDADNQVSEAKRKEYLELLERFFQKRREQGLPLLPE